MRQYVEGQSGTSSKGCCFWSCVTIVGLAVLAAAGVGAVVFYGYNSQASVREVADQYLAALDQGDYPRAYGMLSQEWRANATLEDFSAVESERRSALGTCGERHLAGVSVNKKSGTQSTAEIAYHVTCAAGDTRVDVTLLRNGRAWSVQATSYGAATERVPQRCPACGAAVPRGANFCPACGKSLVPLENPAQQ